MNFLLVCFNIFFYFPNARSLLCTNYGLLPHYYCLRILIGWYNKNSRAAAWSKLGKHEEAVKNCKEALERDPKYSKAYGRMGWVDIIIFQRTFKQINDLIDPSLCWGWKMTFRSFYCIRIFAAIFLRFSLLEDVNEWICYGLSHRVRCWRHSLLIRTLLHTSKVENHTWIFCCMLKWQ